MVTVGIGVTETVNAVVLPTQPIEDVPATEYVVVTLGVTTILEVVAPVDQVYELAEELEPEDK